MTTTRKRRPRSFAGNLQALVSLPDALDADLVRRWGTGPQRKPQRLRNEQRCR